MAETMTREQRDMARHALGLPNKGRCTYRNRYFVAPQTEGAAQWRDLVARGLAETEEPAVPLSFQWFRLTLAGALLALDNGERLDREDFPPLAAAQEGK